MASSRSCNNCGKTSLVRDDVTGQLMCSLCGVIQEYDQFEAHIGGINGPQGTFIRVGTAGAGTIYSYKERKFFQAQSLIDEFTSRLGISSKISDVKAMISTITEGEFGQGDWFQVLIGACVYIVMRKDNRPMSMAEVAWTVGCDVYELGRMIKRVIDFMDLKNFDFPEFDIVHSLERVLKISPSFSRIDRSEMDRIRKQGIFLIQCTMKWFLSTGRKPLPLVVAVLVLVAELNQVEIGISELAKEVHAVVSTCKTRYKELLEKLVEVAQVLPWGRDITKKNIVKHAPSVIKYLETKAMLKPGAKRKVLDRPEFNLADMVSECSRQLDENGHKTDSINLPSDSHCSISQNNINSTRPSTGDSNKMLYSPECLSMLYKKSSDTVDLQEECSKWWNGKSEMSKKLLLKQLLEKDVGFETVPPSFISNCLKSEKRRERISAAKVRIDRIMCPWNSHLAADDCSEKKLKRRKKHVDGVDWEDLIIETLLLHQVKEEEIEKGYYNTLLDLHVFNSGIV